MSRSCTKHGEWVDDRTTVLCPECLADALAALDLLRAATRRPQPGYRMDAIDHALATVRATLEGRSEQQVPSRLLGVDLE